jgi:hypothetical protein
VSAEGGDCSDESKQSTLGKRLAGARLEDTVSIRLMRSEANRYAITSSCAKRDTEEPTDESSPRRTNQLRVDGRLLSPKPDF